MVCEVPWFAFAMIHSDSPPNPPLENPPLFSATSVIWAMWKDNVDQSTKSYNTCIGNEWLTPHICKDTCFVVTTTFALRKTSVLLQGWHSAMMLQIWIWGLPSFVNQLASRQPIWPTTRAPPIHHLPEPSKAHLPPYQRGSTPTTWPGMIPSEPRFGGFGICFHSQIAIFAMLRIQLQTPKVSKSVANVIKTVHRHPGSRATHWPCRVDLFLHMEDQSICHDMSSQFLQNWKAWWKD